MRVNSAHNVPAKRIRYIIKELQCRSILPIIKARGGHTTVNPGYPHCYSHMNREDEQMNHLCPAIGGIRFHQWKKTAVSNGTLCLMLVLLMWVAGCGGGGGGGSTGAVPSSGSSGGSGGGGQGGVAVRAYIAHSKGLFVIKNNDINQSTDFPIAASSGVSGVAVTPDGSQIYVTLFNLDTVAVYQPSGNSVIAKANVPVSNSPYGVAVTPDGNYVYVVCRGNSEVSVIRTSDNNVVATIPLRPLTATGPDPLMSAVTPNGSYVYVSDYNNGEPGNVSVIRTNDNSVAATIPVGAGPEGVAVTPNGNYVYVANYSGQTVTVIRTSDNTVAAEIPVANPRRIAFTPNGNYAYVTSSNGDGRVSMVRTSDNTVVSSFTRYFAWAVAVTPDGNYMYLGSGTYEQPYVDIYRTSDNGHVAGIIVGANSTVRGIAFH